MYDDDVSHFQRVKFMLWYKKMNKLSYQSLFRFLITCKTCIGIVVDLCLRLGWETKKKEKTKQCWELPSCDLAMTLLLLRHLIIIYWMLCAIHKKYKNTVLVYITIKKYKISASLKSHEGFGVSISRAEIWLDSFVCSFLQLPVTNTSPIMSFFDFSLFLDSHSLS